MAIPRLTGRAARTASWARDKLNGTGPNPDVDGVVARTAEWATDLLRNGRFGVNADGDALRSARAWRWLGGPQRSKLEGRRRPRRPRPDQLWGWFAPSANSRVSSKTLRRAAWAVVFVGWATPLLRRRLRLPSAAVTAISYTAPAGLAVALPRSRKRDVCIYALQMWAYIATYQMPYDDPEGLHDRVRVDYPVTIDRWLGLGDYPNVRLQRWLGRPGRVRKIDTVLVWMEWTWFLCPHLASIYIMFRYPERFTRAAAMICGVFDVGLIFYWAVPTAPPWWAAETGRMPPVRRIQMEAGEDFWGRAWPHLYNFFGGNPVAAMPSLHFATSVMAARMLEETGPVAGTVGWSYTLTLGFALVYLGEHYLIDLIAGYALAEAIRKRGSRFGPTIWRGVRVIQALEKAANEPYNAKRQPVAGDGRPVHASALCERVKETSLARIERITALGR